MCREETPARARRFRNHAVVRLETRLGVCFRDAVCAQLRGSPHRRRWRIPSYDEAALGACEKRAGEKKLTREKGFHFRRAC